MNQQIIATLHCPNCGSTFRMNHVLKQDKEDIIHAIISCECHRYPILEGILILQTGENVKTVIEKLKKGSFTDAFEFLVQSELWDSQITIEAPTSLTKVAASFKTLLTFFRRYIVSSKRLSYARKINEISFCELMKKILPDPNYFIHRFSFESFWNIYPLIPLIKDTGIPMLDFGCGFGHESFILSQLFPSKTIVCVEKSYLKLFIAKNYFANAESICLDATSLLPFRDDFFSTVFSMDALHYVFSKQLLAQEFQRVLKTDGVLLLPHLHNAYVYDRAAGSPLPPIAYRKLFDKLKTKLVPEKELLKTLFEGQVDLTKEYSTEQINSSNAVILIGSCRNNLFKRFCSVKQEFLMLKNNLMVNPIYQLKEKNEKFLLVRQIPNEGYRIETPFALKILPQKIVIEKRILHLARKSRAQATEEELKEIHSLMEKFVLINAPAKYM